MNSSCRIDIDAPASLVWEVFSDVERWPEWTASVTHLEALDGPGLAVGKRFAIKQPRLPRLVWTVTELTPGAAWTWAQRSVGGSAIAHHQVIAKPGGRTVVCQEIDQRGPLGALVGGLMVRMTRHYLELEAQGLKRFSEQRANLNGPAS